MLVWVRRRVRQRLLGIAVVGLVAGLGAGVTLAAVAGARRTATTFDRHVQATGAPDAVVYETSSDPERLPDYSRFAELPGVVGATHTLPLLMRPAGSNFEMLLDRWVIGTTDTRFGVEENQFRIIEGRPYDHSRPEEAVVTESFARLLEVEVGDTLRYETWTPPAFEAVLAGDVVGTPEPDGPEVELTVVGIAREFQPLLQEDNSETVYVTEAFTRRWRDEVAAFVPFLLVRLAEGEDGFVDFDAAATQLKNRIPGDWQIDPVTAREAQVTGAIDAQRYALLAVGAAAALAAQAVVLAMLTRQLSFVSPDQFALRALGLTRWDRVIGIVLLATPAVLVAALSAMGLALAVSGLLPIGLPGRVEPDPGFHADWPVIWGGLVIVVVALISLAAVAALSLTRDREPTSRRPGRLAGLPGRAWLPHPAMIGVQLAVERRRGAPIFPMLTAGGGCVIGLSGVVAALVFGASLGHFTSTPRLYGWAADAAVGSGFDPGRWQQVTSELRADPRVDELASFVLVALWVEGRPLNGFIFEPVRGDPLNVVVSGRTPRAADEIVLGQSTAHYLDVGVGGAVAIGVTEGLSRDHTVVGIVATPGLGSNYRESFVVLGDDLDEYALPEGEQPWFGAVVTFADGVDADAALDDYRAEGLAVREPRPARAATNLEDIRAIPGLLAALLAVLSIALLAHALVTGVHRRSRELAVLKALGFSRHQLRSVIGAQATSLAGVSVVLGVPIGVVLGRASWSLVASRLGVPFEVVISLWIVAVAVGALVLANGVAIAPGRRAALVDPAIELRSA